MLSNLKTGPNRCIDHRLGYAAETLSRCASAHRRRSRSGRPKCRVRAGRVLFDRAVGTRKLVDCHFDAVSCKISGDISTGFFAVLGLGSTSTRCNSSAFRIMSSASGRPLRIDGRVPLKETFFAASSGLAVYASMVYGRVWMVQIQRRR